MDIFVSIVCNVCVCTGLTCKMPFIWIHCKIHFCFTNYNIVVYKQNGIEVLHRNEAEACYRPGFLINREAFIGFSFVILSIGKSSLQTFYIFIHFTGIWWSSWWVYVCRQTSFWRESPYPGQVPDSWFTSEMIWNFSCSFCGRRCTMLSS